MKIFDKIFFDENRFDKKNLKWNFFGEIFFMKTFLTKNNWPTDCENQLRSFEILKLGKTQFFKNTRQKVWRLKKAG